jgi:ATP-dependent Clp protease, protease subunit
MTIPPDRDPDVGGFSDPQAWMQKQLFDRRMVLLSGALDHGVATSVGVSLMTLDATGDSAVQLQIDSGDGTVDAALALMDIIDLLGVPVYATCVGQAAGPAVGILAVCDRRMVSPHTRLRLFEPTVQVHGSARQLQQLASGHLDRMTMFWTRLSEATGQSLEHLRHDASRGRFFSAEQAVAYGLADTVAGPDATIHRLPGRSIGFGPR